MLSQRPSIIPPALVPPCISDARQLALAQTFGEALAEIDLNALVASDPLTVDVRLLPYMIREFGAQEFIDPDLPEHVQRRILKNIWSLKSLHGYDAGVKLGLKLLGMSLQIEHRWQVAPKREANTHRLYFFVGEVLFPDEVSVLNARSTRAAMRMIAATKRHSQEGELFVGARLTLPKSRTALRGCGVSLRKQRMTMVQHAPHLRMTSTAAVARGGQASLTQRRMVVGQNVPNVQIHQKSAMAGMAMPTTSRKFTLRGGK